MVQVEINITETEQNNGLDLVLNLLKREYWTEAEWQAAEVIQEQLLVISRLTAESDDSLHLTEEIIGKGFTIEKEGE